MNEDRFETTTPDGTKVIIAPMKSVIGGFARRSMLLLMIYAVLVTAEITLHWYAGTQKNSAAQSLRGWYLEHDPQNGKQYHMGYTDWVIPSEILGFTTGVVLGRSWIWGAELVLWALIFSGGILAPFPYYQKCFPESTGNANTVGYVLGVLQCGFAIAVGRVATAYFLARKSKNRTGTNDSL